MADITLAVGSRYQVLEPLGEGGMGAVYLVEDRVRGEQLALKVLSGNGTLEPDDLLRFKQEFRAMASLRHPNLCAVYDYGQLPDGAPFFTMEHVPGRHLHEAVPQDPQAFLKLVAQLGAALASIHQAGFVHCDLKPENVRVRPDGTLKLMDFGLMVVSGQALDAVRGTLAYVSPEVAKRDRIDQRADLYSLGVVLYELLAGERPIRGSNALQLLKAQLHQVPQPLSALRPDAPEALARVVMKLLAKEPLARYQSAADVLRALGLDSEGAEAQTLLASPFVGRDGQMATLQAGLDRLKQARAGGVLKLVGSAGAGKSRLLGELRCLVQLAETPYLHGTCPTPAMPYGPWISVLKALMPLAREACPALLEEVGPHLAKLLPELAAGQAAVQALEPDQERIMIQTAIARLVVEVTRRAGAVLVLEDWDRADALSVDTLAYLLRNAAGIARVASDAASPLSHVPLWLILAGNGPMEAPGQAVPLDGLDPAGLRDMVAGMLGQTELPERLLTQLHELTGGNPRLVSDTLGYAVAQGAFTRTREGWKLPEQLGADQLATDVKQRLAEQLASLALDARRVARAAAVLGTHFELALVASVVELSEDTLFDALTALVQARVLDTVPGGYRFVTPELAALLYAEEPIEHRMPLHAAAAAWLEAHLGTQPPLSDLDRLARHYLAARQAVAGLPRVLEAALRHSALYASQAADELLSAGRELLNELPDSPAWQTFRWDYLNASASAKRLISQLDEAQALGDKTLELAEQLGDQGRLLDALAGLAQVHNLRGSKEGKRRSVELNERAGAIARALGDDARLARIAGNCGNSLFNMGERERALERLNEAVEAGRRSSAGVYFARALAKRGHLLALTPATRDTGFAEIAEACAVQARIGDKYGEALGQNLLGDLLIEVGRYPEALRTNEAYVALIRELNITDDLVCGLLNVAQSCVELGQFEAALAAMRELEAHVEAGASRGLLPYGLALGGHAAAVTGDFALAETRLGACIAMLPTSAPYVITSLLPSLIEGLLALARPQAVLTAAGNALAALKGQPNLACALGVGEVHALLGEWSLAAAPAEQALGLAREAGAPGATAKALRLQGLIAWGLGREEEATALAEEAYAAAVQLAMLPLQAQVAELRGELAMRSHPEEAVAHFQGMQALADRMNAPLIRARALHGQTRANPHSAQAPRLLAEAQRVVGELIEPLDAAARAEVLASPPCCAIVEAVPIMRAAAATDLESSRAIGQRFTRMTADLQGLASQYDLLFQDWQQSNAQLKQLNALATRMNESLRIEEVLSQVVLLTLEITQAERGFVILKGRGGGAELICRSAFDREGKPLASNSFSLSITQKVMSASKAIAILDAREDADFAAAKSVLALDIKTVMGAPLQSKGEVFGVLYVDSQAIVTTFTERDLELLRSIASHASVAIENAVLYEDLDKRAKELEEALALYRKAERDANTDMLTGLANRRYFHQHVDREFAVAKRYGDPLSVIMVDVDHFKKFNDTYGHAVGDEVLIAVGKALPESVRLSDLPARLGGEEFVVYCPNSTADDVVSVAERIREAIMRIELVDADGRPVRQITASLGIAEVLPHEHEVAQTIERADVALYECKRNGRNQVQIWRPDLVPTP